MIICKNCNKENEEGGNFCVSCGADLSSKDKVVTKNNTTRICEWCAESIPQQAVRCSHCHKWRKDVTREIGLRNIWIMAPVGGLVGASLMGVMKGWSWRAAIGTHKGT